MCPKVEMIANLSLGTHFPYSNTYKHQFLALINVEGTVPRIFDQQRRVVRHSSMADTQSSHTNPLPLSRNDDIDSFITLGNDYRTTRTVWSKRQ